MVKLVNNIRQSRCFKCLVNMLRKGIHNISHLCKIGLSRISAIAIGLFNRPNSDRILFACIIKLIICIFLICYFTTWFFKATHNIEYTINSEVEVLDGYYRIDTVGIDISMSQDEELFIWNSTKHITTKSYAIIRPERPIICQHDLKTCTYGGKRMDSICAEFQIRSFIETKYSKNVNHEEITEEYKYDGSKHIFHKYGDVNSSHEQRKIDTLTVFVPAKHQGYYGEIELGNSLIAKNKAEQFSPNNIYRLCINFKLRWINKNQQDIPKSTLILRMNEPTDFVSIYPEPDVRTLSTIEYHDINKLKSIQSHGLYLLADSLENKNKHDLVMLFLAAILSILLSTTLSILWAITKIIAIKIKIKKG